MNEKLRLRDDGQSLVLVTLMIVGFIALLLLVLDGGYLYLNRRIAQAAADAGALAGARDYCEFELVDKAKGVAEAYVLNNNALTTTDDITVDTSTGEVTVISNIEYETFFGGLFGLLNGEVQATASAICAPPSYSTAPLPVAWSCHPPNFGEDDNPPDDPMNCGLDVWEEAGEPNFNNEEDQHYFYVIMDSEKVTEDTMCVFPPNSMYDTGEEVSCDGGEYQEGYVDCDFDNDCSDDIFGTGNRSWLDFTGGGGGANELRRFIRAEDKLEVRVHSWLGGQPGNIDRVYQDVKTYLEGKDAIIPIFDMYCDHRPDPDNPDETCVIHPTEDLPEVEDWFPDKLEGKGDEHFHVNAFAKFHITCVRSSKSDDCPVINSIIDQFEAPDNILSIEGYFVTGFSPDFGSLTIGGANTETYIVKLTR
jgi:hypothetical protein